MFKRPIKVHNKPKHVEAGTLQEGSFFSTDDEDMTGVYIVGKKEVIKGYAKEMVHCTEIHTGTQRLVPISGKVILLKVVVEPEFQVA